jgi:hypothetical protein
MVEGFHLGCGPISKRSTPSLYSVGNRVTASNVSGKGDSAFVRSPNSVKYSAG